MFTVPYLTVNGGHLDFQVYRRCGRWGMNYMLAHHIVVQPKLNITVHDVL